MNNITSHYFQKSPPLQKVISSYSAPWYIKTMSKIKEFIIKLFNIVCFWKKESKEDSNDRKIRVLDQIKDREFKKKHSCHLTLRESILTSETSAPSVELSSNNKSVYVDKDFHPTIKSMYLCINVLLEKFILSLSTAKLSEQIETNPENTTKSISTLIYTLVQKNSHFLASEISGRIAEIAQDIDFKDLIGKFISLLSLEVKNYLKAEDKIKQEMQTTMGITNFDSEDARNYIYKSIPDEFLKLERNHPKTHKIYSSFSYLEDNDKLHMQDFVNKAFDLIFAPVIIHDNEMTTKVDRLEYIWNRLEIPHPLAKLLNELGFNQEDTRNSFFHIGKSIIKKVITEFLFKIYKDLSSMRSITKIFESIVFQKFIEKTLEKHVQNIIICNHKKLSPIILKFRTSTNKEAIKDELKIAIFKLVKDSCSNFKFEQNNITQESLNIQILNSAAEAIEEVATHENLKSLPIKDLLNELYITIHSETDDRLSELFLDTFLKVGEFQGAWFGKLAAVLKDSINELLGSIIYPIIKDKYRPIEILTSELINKMQFETSFFSRVKIDESNTTPETKLNQKIQSYSNLLFDMGIDSATRESTWVTYPIKKKAVQLVIGNDPTKIHNAINNIFNKLFTHEVMNANLIYKIQDLFLETLENVNVKLAKEEC